VIDHLNVVAVVVVAWVDVDGNECSSDGDGVGWLMMTDEVSLDRHATHQRQVGLTVEQYL
jgi:hypothetical protein